MTEHEKREARQDGAPSGFEEEWRTSAKFRMMVRERQARDRSPA